MKKKIVNIIIQSRQGSKRYPNKVLKKFNNTSLSECLIDRLKNSKYIKNIIFAIPKDRGNNDLNAFLIKKKCKI